MSRRLANAGTSSGGRFGLQKISAVDGDRKRGAVQGEGRPIPSCIPRSLALAVELALVLLLATVLIAQLLSVPANAGTDPDGYVGYARRLLRTEAPTRLGETPGYPSLLVL